MATVTRSFSKDNGDIDTRHDFLPFGESISAGVGGRTTEQRYGATMAAADAAGPRHKFTGKERDVESGLDYFVARYFGSAQGRFTSPDEPHVDQFEDDPQSWNLYSYVRIIGLKVHTCRRSTRACHRLVL